MVTVSASAARQTLPAQLDRVEAGEQVAITRHGRVVAVIVPPGALRSRRALDAWNAADSIAALLDRAREAKSVAALTPERADELVAAIDADRSDA